MDRNRTEVSLEREEEWRDEIDTPVQDQRFQATSEFFSWDSNELAEQVSDSGTTSGEPLRQFQPASMVFQHDARMELSESASESVPLQSVDPPKKLLPPYLCILNHEEFPNDPARNRKGSSKDVEAVRNTFGKLKCQIDEIPNPTLAKVKDTVRALALKSFAHLSALVIVILSHGDQNEKICACDGEEYHVDRDILFPLFENETLANKPKILIIQACKGHWKADSKKSDRNPSSYIKCYSSTEGFQSFRHVTAGSIFIQTLCNVMNQDALTKDFRSIIEDVNAKVERQSNLNGYKQVPSISSTLREPFCFGDFAQNAN